MHEQVNYGQGGSVNVRLIPPPSWLDLPADLLELWAQVAVCGELGGDGQFAPWDEPTWEKKRQELAARPIPWPDFPFPGRVGADRLHWLRTKYANADIDDKPGLAKELLDQRRGGRRTRTKRFEQLARDFDAEDLSDDQPRSEAVRNWHSKPH